jgi:hypothetical protein
MCLVAWLTVIPVFAGMTVRMIPNRDRKAAPHGRAPAYGTWTALHVSSYTMACRRNMALDKNSSLEAEAQCKMSGPDIDRR